MQYTEFILIAALFLIILSVGYVIGKYVSSKEHKEQIPEIRETAIKQSRAVLSGQFSEQIAPYMPDFPFKPTEIRFIGKPIDFIVFKGMDEKKIEEVIFVEVKTGQSKLSSVEKSLKDTIQNKKISWNEYKINPNR
ncbi:MAG TPA: Holliday junction resolvase-like protein [Candidatus Nanoarchaeia archaeon]|nr:Holliday junction resolvase-like protein [Candidatus Nanoarchaeia archaeon]